VRLGVSWFLPVRKRQAGATDTAVDTPRKENNGLLVRPGQWVFASWQRVQDKSEPAKFAGHPRQVECDATRGAEQFSRRQSLSDAGVREECFDAYPSGQEKVFAMQRDCDGSGLNPAGHGEQDPDPAGAYSLALQLAHVALDVAPTAMLARPAGQGVHDTAPSTSLNVPSGHNVHEAELLPPGWGRNEPRAQNLSQIVAPNALVHEPAAQRIQESRPTTGEKLPG
jgi:hypothetical protein